MLYALIHKKRVVSPPLLEARQDETCVLLRKNPQGLISWGQYNCYALIVKYGAQVALAHVSNAEGTSPFLNDMISRVSKSGHAGVEVYLARSFTGYTTGQEEDRQDCLDAGIPFDEDDAETYFQAMDTEYTEIFKKDFASIKPVFITMPHDFLVIDANGAIKLYEEYGANEIKIKKAVLSSSATSSNNASSSPAFFSPPQAAASQTPAPVAGESQKNAF